MAAAGAGGGAGAGAAAAAVPEGTKRAERERPSSTIYVLEAPVDVTYNDPEGQLLGEEYVLVKIGLTGTSETPDISASPPLKRLYEFGNAWKVATPFSIVKLNVDRVSAFILDRTTPNRTVATGLDVFKAAAHDVITKGCTWVVALISQFQEVPSAFEKFKKLTPLAVGGAYEKLYATMLSDGTVPASIVAKLLPSSESKNGYTEYYLMRKSKVLELRLLFAKVVQDVATRNDGRPLRITSGALLDVADKYQKQPEHYVRNVTFKFTPREGTAAAAAKVTLDDAVACAREVAAVARTHATKTGNASDENSAAKVAEDFKDARKCATVVARTKKTIQAAVSAARKAAKRKKLGIRLTKKAVDEVRTRARSSIRCFLFGTREAQAYGNAFKAAKKCKDDIGAAWEKAAAAAERLAVAAERAANFTVAVAVKAKATAADEAAVEAAAAAAAANVAKLQTSVNKAMGALKEAAVEMPPKITLTDDEVAAAGNQARTATTKADWGKYLEKKAKATASLTTPNDRHFHTKRTVLLYQNLPEEGRTVLLNALKPPLTNPAGDTADDE